MVLWLKHMLLCCIILWNGIAGRALYCVYVVELSLACAPTSSSIAVCLEYVFVHVVVQKTHTTRTISKILVLYTCDIYIDYIKRLEYLIF
jgi:hypothetical protein